MELCDAGDLGIKVNASEFKSFINVFPMMYLCQFGQNLDIGEEDRVQTSLFIRPW